MLSKCTILLSIGFMLSSGSTVTIASDENPWSMEEFDDGRQSYYDLNGGALSGPFYRGKISGPNETTVSKNPLPQGRNSGESGMGKGHRDEVFGYAGPQPKAKQRLRAPVEFGQFGSLPSAGGQIGRKRKNGPVVRRNDGVQYGGRSFGAFPPEEKKSDVQGPRSARDAYGHGQRVPRQPPSAFANVPPVPIPDPLPQRAYPYPYSGYARVPGYGAGYGTEIAPGLGAYGLGTGPEFGASPGLPGFAMPGFMW